MIVSMINYLLKVIDDFLEVIRSTDATRESEHLFRVRDEKDRNLLPEEKAQQFHHTIVQLLFLCIRVLPDIQPLVSFLTTRVRSPDEYDWGKLKRV